MPHTDVAQWPHTLRCWAAPMVVSSLETRSLLPLEVWGPGWETHNASFLLIVVLCYEDILICPCINLFWKAVRPCKKERWSSFLQNADRVPSRTSTTTGHRARAWHFSFCTRVLSLCSAPSVPSWSRRSLFVLFFVFSPTVKCIVFSRWSSYHISIGVWFSSLHAKCLFSPIPDCKVIVVHRHISRGDFIQWQQTSLPGKHWCR